MNAKTKKYGILLLLVLVAGFGVGYFLQRYTFGGRVCLVALGASPPGQLRVLKAEIERFYHFRVHVLPAQPVPPEAFYPPRKRYKADLILPYLRKLKPAGQDKIIALVQTDISAKTKKHDDWGVMGLAWLDGCCGVVSTYRLRRDRPTASTFNQRLIKVTLHEVGHTLGLEHCNQSPRCLMNDAKGSVKTVDRASVELCAACRRQIQSTQRYAD